MEIWIKARAATVVAELDADRAAHNRPCWAIVARDRDGYEVAVLGHRTERERAEQEARAASRLLEAK